MILEKIKRKSIDYNLTYNQINDTTLRIYRKNELYDSWLIIHKPNSQHIILKHKCKIGYKNKRKEYYHLQKKISIENWIWSLQRINSHYRYKTGVQRKHPIDKILEKYNLERKIT